MLVLLDLCEIVVYLLLVFVPFVSSSVEVLNYSVTHIVIIVLNANQAVCVELPSYERAATAKQQEGDDHPEQDPMELVPEFDYHL